MTQLAGALGAFLIVLGLSYAAARLLGGAGRVGRARHLRLVDALPLGRERQVLVVALGERYYLLGATAEQVSLLEALSPEQAAALQEEAPPVPGFAALLRRFTERSG